MVRARLRRADTRTAARMAGDRERRSRAHPGTHGLGEDARCVPGRHRPAQRDARGRPAPALRLAAQGAELRHRAEPAKPARRARLEALGRGAHRGHACRGAAPNAADPSGHPHHHARVAVPAPHLAGTRDASRDRDRDPRRGARGRRHEARRAPGAVARATRAPRRRSLPAPRALGDAAADGGDRAVRRRLGPRDPARRRGRPQGAGPPGRRSGRGHARAAVDGRALRAAARGRGRDGRRRRAVEPVDLAVDLPGDPRARQAAPLDDRLREQPAPRGAARASHQRARRRGARPGAPRLARARAAARRRGAAEGRPDPVPRRDVLARARHRHGRRRPRDPGGEPEVGRARAAARRARGPRPALGLEGADLPEVPRRPPRVGGRRARHARRGDRGDADSAQSARRARPADRRDLRRRGGLGGRAPRARAARVSVLGALACAARERPRHARGPLPVRRVRGAAAADRVGSDRRHGARAHRRAAPRGHQRRDDPGPRPLRRLPRRRGRARGRARRGDGVRGARGPDVRARSVDLAHRGDHARPRPRLACSRRARHRSVLEGRGSRTPRRAR